MPHSTHRAQTSSTRVHFRIFRIFFLYPQYNLYLSTDLIFIWSGPTKTERKIQNDPSTNLEVIASDSDAWHHKGDRKIQSQ